MPEIAILDCSNEANRMTTLAEVIRQLETYGSAQISVQLVEYKVGQSPVSLNIEDIYDRMSVPIGPEPMKQSKPFAPIPPWDRRYKRR